MALKHRENRKSILLPYHTKGDNGPQLDFAPWHLDTQKVHDTSEFRDTDYSQPGWRQRLKRGQPCFTYLKGQDVNVVFTPGRAFRVNRNFDNTVRYVLTSYGCLYYSEALASFVGNTSVTRQAQSLAIQEFIAQCRKAQTAFSGGTFLAELRETLQMLRNPAKRLFKGLGDYHRESRKRLPRRFGRDRKVTNRILRDTWLEYAFGWAPFIGDIQDACKALRRMQGPINPSRLVSSGIQQPFRFVQEDVARNAGDLSGQVVWDYRVLRENWVTYQYNGLVRLNVDELGFRIASQNFGFSTQDFFPTLWEVIPYSFLVDYFTNIGAIISTLSFNTASLGVVYQTIRKGHKMSVYDSRLRKPFNPAFLISESFEPGKLVVETKTVERDRYFGPYVPQLEVRIPGMGLKWLNMAALTRFRSHIL